MDSKQLAEWLQALELAQVTVTATIDHSGRLGSVGGLWPKLLAATKEAALGGLLRVVVVAAEQPDVSSELLAPDVSLRVLKAATLYEAVQKLYEEHGPRDTVRRYEREHCARIDLLGRSVSLEQHYQILPLLRAVKRERLPHRPHSSPAEDKEELQLRPTDILRWEEELREERITYEGVTLEQVFNDFQSAAKETRTTVPRFVVLGPPGSGKTTLMQYLGWQAANGSLCVSGRLLLPVRMRLREWETWTTRARDDRLPQYLTEHYKDLPFAPRAEQWQYWLRKGEVLLLLDGLDEIEGNSTFLTAVKTALAACAACPLVITCRTVSFEQHRTLCPDFPIFTLAGLEPDKRDAFVRTFPAEHTGHYDPGKLIDQLNCTPQMRPLAANPLLLTIICYVVDDAKGSVLPATRGELYARVLEKLLLPHPRVEIRYPAEVPHTGEKLTILQRAALHLFAQGDRKLTFTGQELGQALQQALKEERYGEALAPWANALRGDLTHNSGILRESGEQGSFFLHLTVQEFLAAKALASVVHERGWETPTVIAGMWVSVRQLIDKKAWDPRWQEVITLLAGQLADPLPLLRLLADEKQDDVFSHRLALAAQCLPEVRLPLRAKLSTIADRITDSLFSRWLQHETQGTTAAIPCLTRALPALGQVNARIESVPFVQWLCLRLRDVNPDVRSGVVEALGLIGESIAQHPHVLSTLVVAFQDKDVLARAKVAETFRRIGGIALQHPDALPVLVRVALHDEDWFVRFGATRAIEQMGKAALQHPEARLVWLKTQHEENQHRNTLATNMATQKTIPMPPLIEAASTLVAALRNHDSGIRAQAAEMCKQMGDAGMQHPQVLPTLLEVALHDTDGGVRARAVEALGQVGAMVAQHPEVLLVLVAALHDGDSGVRSQSAKALGQLAQAVVHRLDVLSALIDALRDKESDVRCEAAETLGQMMAQGVRVFRRWWRKVEGKTVEELASL